METYETIGQRYVERLFNQAREVGNSKSLLLKRFKEYLSCLNTKYKPYFKSYTLDFTNKTLIGSSGYYIQWINNGNTSIGSCTLYRE